MAAAIFLRSSASFASSHSWVICSIFGLSYQPNQPPAPSIRIDAGLTAGKFIALANKEPMVMAGRLMQEQARKHGVRIFPVDSEHSALFQSMEGHRVQDIRRLILTASGGPFWNLSWEQLRDVTVEQALKHPNWKMGDKITIDSATLMNKGLEIMEAHHLFGTPYERIDVVVHPQSVIHGLVQLADGAMLAHLGPPDMRIAISYALHGADSVGLADGPRPVVPLDLTAVGELTFEAVDLDAFPCLRLAGEAARRGGTAPCVLNASNEIAVHAFLEGRLRFLEIPAVIEQTLSELGSEPVRAFESLYEADRQARILAARAVTALA